MTGPWVQTVLVSCWAPMAFPSMDTRGQAVLATLATLGYTGLHYGTICDTMLHNTTEDYIVHYATVPYNVALSRTC